MSAANNTAQPAGRIIFIDNLRVFLTVLVLMHHSMITYAGVGGWYYREGRQDTLTTVLGAMFCGVNQAFFMAFFFMIAAYFTVASIGNKGPAKFVKDRLVRLGIPIVVYDFLINPAILYALNHALGKQLPGIADFYVGYVKGYDSIATGPLWFISALLQFSIVYAVVSAIWKKLGAKSGSARSLPGLAALIAFCILTGFAAFAVRLWMPVGKEIELVNFQVSYFVLYIAMFVAGIAAFRGDWFMSISNVTGRRWFVAAHVFILLMPVMMVLGGALDGKEMYFMGGMHFQSLVYSMWEPFVCVGMCAGLTVIFRKRFNTPGVFQKFLSRNAYTVYLIHAPVLVIIALAMRPLMLHPLLKLAILASAGISACYILSHLIRKIPYTDRVL